LYLWIQAQLDDEKLFPKRMSSPFPNDFIKYVTNIMRRLFRVYAHIYRHHLDAVFSSKTERDILDAAFGKFYAFVGKKQLIPQQELDALKDIIPSVVSS